MNVKTTAIAILLLPFALTISSCSTNTPTPAPTTTGTSGSAPLTATPSPTANPYGTPPPVDPPGPNDPVLTVTGTNGTLHAYTLTTLQTLGTTQATIYEPFIKHNQTFTVIPMKTLLDAAGLTGNQWVKTHALNDYTYPNTATYFDSNNALLAFKADGTNIPIDKGGPIRIIFPDNSPAATNLDAWNWSLDKIEATTAPSPSPTGAIAQ